MKNIIKLFIVSIFLILNGNLFASHSKGGYVTYTHLGGNTYHITMVFFRDCSGITPSTSIFMTYSSASCGLTGNVTLNQTGVINSSSVCPAQITNTVCDGGVYIGEQQYTFEADVTLPGNCPDWIFNYSECCLPGSVTTLVSSGSQSMYFESTLDNFNVPGNNSPILTAPPMGQVCTGMSNTYNFAAVDPDGDSLSYALVTGMQNVGTPVTYTGGYSGGYPMSSVPALAIDPVTGDITYNSNALQEALIAVRIYEWRNGVLIASHLRQWLLTTQTCSNSQPAFSSITNVSGAVQTGPNVIEVCPGTPVTFQFTSSDPDPATVLTMNAVSSYPGATFTTTGTNPITGTFTWTPTVGFVGTNNIVFSVTDNTCPYPGTDYSTVALTVIQQTYAGPDQNYCSAQGPLTLNAIGGTTFNWSVISGDPTMSCTNCASPTVSPSVTTTYQVVSDLTGTCVNTDQVTITVVPSFTFTTTGDQDVCTPFFGTSSVALTATPSPAGTYTYSWQEVGGTWTSSSQSPSYLASQDENLAVVVSSSLGCVLSDTLLINTISYDDTPDWSLSSNATPGCPSGPIDLTATVSYGATCDVYTATNIPFAPVAGVGNAVVLGDDQVSGVLPIGFNFNFYCTSYSNFYISSNGFITFNAASSSGCCSGLTVPSNDGVNNMIAFAWNDLYPPAGGTIDYQTIGVAPNRKLVVNYNNVNHCCGAGPINTGQIILYEADSKIEIHSTTITNDGSTVTQGIENATGTIGVAVPGFNSTTGTMTNTAWRFSNSGNEPYLVTWQQPVGTTIGTSNPLTVSPSGTTTYTAILSDPTGVCVSGTQTLTINGDNIAPVPNVSPLADINAACSVTSLTAPTATDNCSGTVTGTHNATLPITTAGTTVVTWTYTDASGNTATQTQNVIINDNAAPVPNVATLSNITAPCSVTSLTAPTATDNCSGAITGTHNATLPITTTGTTVVTWTYVDGSGNSSTQTQNVIINDNVAPVPNTGSLSNITAPCSVASLTAPTATDNCSGVLTGVHNATLPITSQGTTVVTWTYTDASGNIATQTQNVVINDNVAPVPNVGSLSTITAPCSVSTLTAPTATDNCTGAVTGTHNATLPITSQGTTIVTWTYTDVSGNTSTQTQNVVINDNIAPVPDVASLPNVTGACSVSSLIVPTATDNCSGIINGTHNATLPITNQGTTIVTWTFTDASGNTSTQNQNIVINDNVAPVPSVGSLPNVTSTCSVATLSAPTATDNCGGAVTVTNNAVLPITTQGTTVVTWTYTDANGNSSTQNQNVVISDNIAPTPNASSLPDVSASCSVTSLTSPTATDNCGGVVNVTNNAVLPIVAQGTTVVTWTYTDLNGNSSTQTQNVIINDNIAPVPDVASLADVTTACSVTSLTAPTATDNCTGIVTVTNNATLPINTQGTTIVTWTYTDSNGNSVTQNQNVVINDNLAPVPNLGVLPDITAACFVATLTAPTATDNCSGTVTATHNATLPLFGSTVVVWTYVDANGNSSTQNQNVIINDNVAPTPDLATLPNVTGQCSVTTLTSPTGTDNCGGLVTVTNNATLPITAIGTTVVTWTYTDDSGNSTTQNQNVIITGNPTYSTINTSTCGTYTAPSGTVLSSTGTYTDIIPNSSGCDSIITINLTVDNSYLQNITAIYCQQYTVPSGNATYYVSGIYNDTLTTVNGCDSILVIDLTILQVDNGVTQNGIVLTANAVGAEYSWFNCATGVDVFGATNQSFTPVYNGTYAVVVLQNGCYDTSACFTVNSADLPDMDFTKFQVYPNPTTGVFTIQGVGLAGKELVILDLNGRSIRNEQLINDESVINISEYHRGVYILKIDESVIRIVLD